MSDLLDSSSEKHPAGVTRRHFLKSTAAGLLASALVGGCGALGAGGRPMTGVDAPLSFRSGWPAEVERYWAGPEYWANPLSEWRLARGRLEFMASEEDRTLHHLTRRLGEADGTLDLRVLTGFSAAGRGRAGFEVGVQGPLGNYRNDAVRGRGLRAGVTSAGRLFVGDERVRLRRRPGEEGLALHLTAIPTDGGYVLALSALDAATGEELGELRLEGVQAGVLRGNVALFAAFEDEEPWGTPRVWFRDWEGRGTKLVAHDERAWGPILFGQHTLSRGVMKLTAQLAPVEVRDDRLVQLQVQEDGEWQTIAEAPVDSLSRTAAFRVAGWDATRDVPYRLVYRYRTASGLRPHFYEGTIRRDPVDKETIVVGGLSCAKDTGFPNTEIVQGLAHHDPDVLAFTGDQYYEETGGYVRRAARNVPLALLDVLHRWYIHGWSFGDLARDRPSITILDDHDVFHGNIWGEGGELIDRFGRMADGGFFMPPEWVNAVQRMQTSHLPDPYDPTPVKNGITVYYTDMLYGRVSFAILEDRKWKTGPRGLVDTDPDTPADWIVDPDFDPEQADVPGAELLGSRQLAFLDDWAADWRGTAMKCVVSQSSLAQLPTHHGPRFKRLVADLDSNGWPQTPRDEALRRFRKAFAFHLGGDQHLPMLLRYGIDEWNDAPYNYCVPAVAVGWTRACWPDHPGRNHQPGMPDYTGEYLDGFDNRMTVYAVANPERDYASDDPLQRLQNKSSGYGIVRFHKPTREITMEAWPILSDPRRDDTQYPGWPKTVHMLDNYARTAAAYLPTLEVDGAENPMVQVIDEASGEVVYTLRIEGRRFRPKVFREGTYMVRIGDDTAWRETLEGLTASPEEATTRQVRL